MYVPFAEGLQNMVNLASRFSRGQLNSLSCNVYKVLNIVPSIHKCPVVVATNIIIIINNFSVGRIVANLPISFPLPHLTDKNFGLHNIAFSFNELKDY